MAGGCCLPCVNDIVEMLTDPKDNMSRRGLFRMASFSGKGVTDMEFTLEDARSPRELPRTSGSHVFKGIQRTNARDGIVRCHWETALEGPKDELTCGVLSTFLMTNDISHCRVAVLKFRLMDGKLDGSQLVISTASLFILTRQQFLSISAWP